ncbi:MAG: LCP family protein [Armatimonadota bacterium]
MYFGSQTVRQIVHDWRTGMWQPDKSFPGKDNITLLFLGKDVDLDNHARVLKTNGRTDTILLVRLDFKDQTANILSIPRDTRVRIPGYRGKHKINAAHAFGGPELCMETIENFLDIKPEEYIVVDYKSFEKAIDALGGLQVAVDKQMDYDDNWGNLHIHLKPGTQVLDGREALGFVRFRKSNDGHSVTDQQRIARQHQFLMAAKGKIMSKSVFLHLPELIDTLRSGVNSSMSDAQLMTVAKFIKTLPKESIRTAILPNNDSVYVTAKDSDARKLVNQMF